MSQKARQPAKPGAGSALTDRTKKIVLGVLAGVIVIGGGWYAYYELTTVPPPNLENAKGQQVADYLGNPRGFARLSVDERQDFLVRTCQRYAYGEPRHEFVGALHRMSSRERQVFLDAFYDVGRTRVMDHAQDFSKLTSAKQKRDYIDDAIRDFGSIRASLGGTAPPPSGVANIPQGSFGDPFKNDLPRGSDELMKVVVSKTTARERKDVKPFVDAVAARYKELQKNGELDKLLMGG